MKTVPAHPPIYLDHAAATPLSKRAFVAMQPYMEGGDQAFYNPSSPYMAARAVRQAVDTAKAMIGRVIGARADELIMTGGATESINLAINGVASTYPKGVVAYAATEHVAVSAAAQATGRWSAIPVNHNGIIDLDALTDILPRAVLLSVGLANNEIGTIQPFRKITALVAKERLRREQAGEDMPLFIHTDASQAVGLLDVSVARLGVDLMSLNAGKCGGPKGVGCLWAASYVRLQPVNHGGGQERGLRSGTENVAGIVGFAAAMAEVSERRSSIVHTTAERRDSLADLILKQLPDTHITATSVPRLAGSLHVAWDGLDGERLVYALDDMGVLVATGSACAANKGTRSHVLTAIGMKPSLADGSVRISLGRHTSDDDIEWAARAIVAAVQSERRVLGL